MSEGDQRAPTDALRDEELDQVAGGTTLVDVSAAAQFKSPVSAPTGLAPTLPQPPTVFFPAPAVQVGTFVQVSLPPGLPVQAGPLPPPGTLPILGN